MSEEDNEIDKLMDKINKSVERDQLYSLKTVELLKILMGVFQSRGLSIISLAHNPLVVSHYPQPVRNDLVGNGMNLIKSSQTVIAFGIMLKSNFLTHKVTEKWVYEGLALEGLQRQYKGSVSKVMDDFEIGTKLPRLIAAELQDAGYKEVGLYR